MMWKTFQEYPQYILSPKDVIDSITIMEDNPRSLKFKKLYDKIYTVAKNISYSYEYTEYDKVISDICFMRSCIPKDVLAHVYDLHQELLELMLLSGEPYIITSSRREQTKSARK